MYLIECNHNFLCKIQFRILKFFKLRSQKYNIFIRKYVQTNNVSIAMLFMFQESTK